LAIWCDAQRLHGSQFDVLQYLKPDVMLSACMAASMLDCNIEA